jgi:hypothetical protein
MFWKGMFWKGSGAYTVACTLVLYKLDLIYAARMSTVKLTAEKTFPKADGSEVHALLRTWAIASALRAAHHLGAPLMDIINVY